MINSTKINPGLYCIFSKRLNRVVRTLKAFIVAINMKKAKKAVRKTSLEGSPLRTNNARNSSFTRKIIESAAIKSPV